MPSWLAQALVYVLGFVFSIVLGHYLIRKVLDRFYRGYEEGRTVENWRAGVVGLVERALYTTAFLLGSPEFIAIWLALKVAGQWERWKADWSSKARASELKDKKDTARAMYSGYLLGNALSIAYAIAGALFISNGIKCHWAPALLPAASLLIATWFLYIHIKKKTPQSAISTGLPPKQRQRRRGSPKRAA